MITIRTLAFYLGFGIWTIFWGTVSLLFAFLPREQRYWFAQVWARVTLVWLAFTCGIRHHVTGLEQLPQQPVVILANHQSAWETIAFLTIFPRFAYVLKKELFRMPFFGWALQLFWPIGIDRDAGRDAVRQVLDEGQKRIDAGVPVIVFPEGTRQPRHQLGKFASTGAGLAVKASTALVPVAHNAGSYWPRTDWRKQPGIVQVRVGPPLNSKGKTAITLNREAQDWISGQLKILP